MLAVTPALPGCALFRSHGSSLSGSVVLGPGGRAEGHVSVPAGDELTLEMRNAGPGRADHVLRRPDGATISQGPLSALKSRVLDSDPSDLLIVVEAYDDAGTTVEYDVKSDTGVRIDWDLSRAFRREE